jgi:phenylalanyl-tRNA synthetase beta chain
VLVAGKRIGTFGPLHPDAILALETGSDVFVLELDLEPFVQGRAVPQFGAIPRFPASTRDVALVVRDSVMAGQVETAVREAAGALAEDVRLFDRFTGGQVPAGCASLAFHVVYRAQDRTLTDADVDAAHANVVKAVGERFGATLR